MFEAPPWSLGECHKGQFSRSLLHGRFWAGEALETLLIERSYLDGDRMCSICQKICRKEELVDGLESQF